MKHQEHLLKRSIGPVPLMLTGLGSIIGAGWLFGAWHAAALAGSASIFSWVNCADLRRARRHVSRNRRHGALCTLLSRVTRGIYQRVGQLDLDRCRDPDRGNRLRAVHGIVALSMGAGNVFRWRVDHIGAGRQPNTDRVPSTGQLRKQPVLKTADLG